MQRDDQRSVQHDVAILRWAATFAAHQKRMPLQQTVRCTSKLHIKNASAFD
jgi:hypothetical protein